MDYSTTRLIPAYRARGIETLDLRGKLPWNTTYRLVKAWSTRPVSAISIVAVHYDARPLRPPLPYDAPARYAQEALAHIRADWGGGYHAPTIAYHAKIDGAGRLYVLNDAEAVTWNANNANGIDYSLCLDLGEGQDPLPAQLVTLNRALDTLCKDSPELPVSESGVWGHGELTDYGNATACPGAALPFVQRYRKTGSVFGPQVPLSQEIVNMLSDQELASVASQLWGATPFVADFAIPRQWIVAYRDGHYLGKPSSGEASVNGLTFQEFERGLIVYRQNDGYCSYKG